jgi:cellulose synthase/poly-beta-1,6-N-acetylglucosamine synthase-like glycosyltransferase
MSDAYRVSAVVPAYDEERNIEHMLDSLLTQRSERGELAEVVVVASGCTDGTVTLVERYAVRDRRVRLLTQPTRQGKVAAVNAYLAERDPAADVLLVASADVLLAPGFLDALLRAFDADPRVGMCGGRPVPSNGEATFMGSVGAMLWDLHHDVASIAPKLGEAIAVRASLLPRLPDDAILDEASIEAIVTLAGYSLRYVPEAVVVNRGPETLREFVEQRRRNAAGHYALAAETGYRVSTLAVTRLVLPSWRRLRTGDPRTATACVAAIGLEIVARTLGRLDTLRGRSHAVWKIASSAHDALAPPPRASGDAAVQGKPNA